MAKLKAFFKKQKLISYRKGEVILKPGEELKGVGFVKSGFVRVFLKTKDGREITLPMFKPLFYFSFIYHLTGMENKYYFETITPVEMWVAPYKECLKFLKLNTAISFELFKEVLTCFMEITNNAQKLISGDAYEKVARLIIYLARRFGEEEDKTVKIKFFTTHKMIASITGLTRETVTIQILRLEKEGYIVNKGKRIVVKNIDKMEKAIDER